MLGRIVNIRREEWPRVLLMFSYFFLVILVFQILKPMKKGLFLEVLGPRAAEWELVAKGMNILVAAAAMAVFSFLAGRLRRDRLVLLFGTLFAGAFLAYGRLLAGHREAWVVWSFYLLGDLFATVMVALFWAFLNDISPPEQARRLYGFIGAGGVVGGFTGNTIVRGGVGSWGISSLLLVGAALTIVIVLIAVTVHLLHERARKGAGEAARRGSPERRERARAGTASAWGEALEGMRLVARSRYLLTIVAMIGLYEVTSTILDYQFSATVVHWVPGATDKQVFLAAVGQVTGVVSIVVQLLLTSFILTRLGVGTALLVLPLAILLSSLVFFAAPTLLAGAALSVSDNGLSYSINQTSKEVLYTPTSREEKYKAKAFIDMFVQRTAKGIAVGVSLAVSVWVGFSGVRFLSLVVLGILACWILVARAAGREFRRRVEPHAGQDRFAGTPGP